MVIVSRLFHADVSSRYRRFAQTATNLLPWDTGTDENLFVRKPMGGSTRLRWVSEQSKHRRTATRQRSIRRSTPKQFPLYTAQQRVPLEDGPLKIV
jgi:hypothetical protein